MSYNETAIRSPSSTSPNVRLRCSIYVVEFNGYIIRFNGHIVELNGCIIRFNGHIVGHREYNYLIHTVI